MKNALKTLPLAAALALCAGPAFALGLGTIQVQSQLNQPLVAEIPLLGVGAGDLDTLSVRLAPPDAFERVGLPTPVGTTANLQFSVGRNARGEPVVRVTTTSRVDDPFVSFLLEADWGRGSVVREFTLLIDPPHIAAATVQAMTAPTVAAAPLPAPREATPEPAEPVAAAPAVADEAPAPAELLPEPEPAPAPEPIAAAPPPAPEPVPAAPVPPPAAAPAAPPPAAEPAAVLPPPAPASAPGSREVVAGDTLWEIASDSRQGATMAQMMLAIQRANPDAFLRDNINLLRKGAVLRIPGADEAAGSDRAEAEAQVQEQMVAWRALSPSSAPAPAPFPGEAPLPAAAPASRSAVAAAPGSGPRLEIAPPSGEGQAGAQSGAAGGGSGSELRAELQQVREDLSARDAELAELRSRLSEQEALANEQQNLISLKDSQLSALEESLRQQRTDAAGESAAADVAAAEAPGSALSDPAGQGAQASAETSTAQPAVGPSEVPAAAPPAAEAPTAGSAWFESPLVWGGAALLMVGGLVALLRRRRPAPAALPVPAMAAAPGGRSKLSDDEDFFANLSPAGTDRTLSGEDRAAAEDSFEDSADIANTGYAGDTSEITDAVVDELQREVAAVPQDLERHVALVRELYNAGDAEGFLVAAEAMRERVADSADPRWREVVVMGMGLVPGHAMFREVRWNPVNSVDVVTRGPKASAALPAAPSDAEALTPQQAFDAEPVADMDDTRLELAKAYIEIGDADGARGMLQEVLNEGSDAARAEAERLLRELG